MPNPKVGLFKRVNVGGKWLCCPVVHNSNGRVRADRVVVDGREEVHPEGAFYISWREDGKLLRRSVGKNATEAVNRKLRLESILSARANGVSLEDPNQASGGKGLLVDAVRDYLNDIKLTKKPKTHSAYKTALDYFLASCKKQYVREVERRDMLQYGAFLRDEKDQSPRSVYNKFENVMSFLKKNGVRGIVSKGDWPRYVEEEPEIYEREDLDKFFKCCSDEERLWFEFFLMSGLREQEVMHAT